MDKLLQRNFVLYCMKKITVCFVLYENILLYSILYDNIMLCFILSLSVIDKSSKLLLQACRCVLSILLTVVCIRCIYPGLRSEMFEKYSHKHWKQKNHMGFKVWKSHKTCVNQQFSFLGFRVLGWKHVQSETRSAHHSMQHIKSVTDL